MQSTKDTKIPSVKGFRTSRLGKRWTKMLFLLVLVIASTIIFSLISRSPLEKISRKESSLDAIVTVAMCGFHAMEMVQSLRTMGQWKGPIYVITDTPITMEQDLHHLVENHTTTTTTTIRNRTITTTTTNHEDSIRRYYTEINVKGHHPIFDTQQEFDQYVQGIHRFKATIYSKWHKTQIFKLIPSQDNINNVLFLDADMLAQKSLMDHWLPSIEPLLVHGNIPSHKQHSQNDHHGSYTIQQDNCPISLYPERWYTSLPILGKHDISLSGKYNSGMMILKRHASQSILEKWGDALVRPPFVGRDQGKLTQVLDEMGVNVCFLPNHWAHVQNEADIMDRIWFQMVGKGTFLHISSAKKETKYQHWNHQLMQECNYTKLVFPSTVQTATVSDVYIESTPNI